MGRQAFLGALAVALAAAGVYACAVGADTGDDSTGSGGLHDAASEAEPFDGYDTTDEAGGDAGEEAGGGTDDAGTKPEGGTPSDCVSPNNCNTARATVPANISGDTSPANNSVTVQGSRDEWIKVRATEDSHSTFGATMTVKAVLTSPSGGNYNLDMFVNDSTDAVSCSGPVETSSVPGSQTDQVVHQWGETGTFSNGSDDSRTVTFHVKYASGPCGPGNEWTMVISGNP